MLHAAPAQIRQVQQPVNSAEVHEGPVLRNVFHVPVHDLTFAQRFHQCGALGMQCLFEQRAPAHHHVAAAPVQLGDPHLQFRAGQVVQVLRRPQVVLRARQEGAHADIHHQAALDAVHHFAGECFLGLKRCFNLLPRAAAQHLQIGQDREAVLVLPGALHLDRAVRLRARYFRVREFRRGNQPFRLSSQIHYDAMFRVGHNLDLDHLVRRSRFLLLVVLL